MPERDVQSARAVQVGALMRSYREAFLSGDGRRGLTQEALLARMAAVDSDYAERYSHGTVSRWESGGTRPTLRRLRVFGTALNLSRAETAGLLLLAGLAPDYQAALRRVSGDDGDEAASAATRDVPAPSVPDGVREPIPASASPAPRAALRFWVFRSLPLGVCIVGCGYALSYFGMGGGWMPFVYIAFVLGVVLAQGFLFPDPDAGLREFFWVSLFFLLTTPLLQFAQIRTDHYNFYAIRSLTGTQLPYMLALIMNLVVASIAARMFQRLWQWQYASGKGGSHALQRAVWVTLPPVVFVYAVVLVTTNIWVSMQLAILLPAFGAVFTMLMVLRDPALSLSERDRRFLLSTTMAVGMVGTALGTITVLTIFVSPDLPGVLPDHNLLRSWEIDFAALGHSREQALDRLNLGYAWHAAWVLGYMVIVVGGHLIVAIHRIGRGQVPGLRH